MNYDENDLRVKVLEALSSEPAHQAKNEECVKMALELLKQGKVNEVTWALEEGARDYEKRNSQ